MEPWQTNLLIAEGIFLVTAFFLFGAVLRLFFRTREEKKQPGKLAAVAGTAVGLVFLRRWLFDQEMFRDSAERLQEQVAELPGMLEVLRDTNDTVFNFVFLLCIPGAFMAGWLFKTFTSAGARLLVRAPVVVAGVVALAIGHQIATEEADSVGEAVDNLKEQVSELMD